ncbi:MAG: DUF1292 domain-containing protein [Bacilli bacterium]|jgi:uncharacterized protein YrzB (UPF0473 family)|nr:DUF1292 domain-containing protein [Bacilli bacterium]NLT01534.1 DUF1292 domain-containing protein [Acholeplasmataceae bacterium]
MENERQLIFIDEKGDEVLCDILFTFDSEEFKKSYVLFSPVGSGNENGEMEVAAASYIPGEDGAVGELFAIETDEEWALIEDMLAHFDEEYGDDCDCEECDCEECEDDCEDEECCCCEHEHK